MTVGELCTKGVVTATRDDSLVEAARRMRGSHVGDVVVVDPQGRVVGMLTDRDIVVSAVAQSPEKVPSLLVGDVMSTGAVTIKSNGTLDEAFATMKAHGIRRLPVVGSAGRVEGILTLDDLVRRVSGEFGRLVDLIAVEQSKERQVRAAS